MRIIIKPNDQFVHSINRYGVFYVTEESIPGWLLSFFLVTSSVSLPAFFSFSIGRNIAKVVPLPALDSNQI